MDIDAANDATLQSLLEDNSQQVLAIKRELARRKAQAREDAYQRAWSSESGDVAARKARDLAIIEAIIDGETRKSVGLRFHLYPQTISLIYARFESRVLWPGSEWAYRDYPAELVAKWARANPNEAGRAKYWYEQAFAEVQTINDEHDDETALVLEPEDDGGH